MQIKTGFHAIEEYLRSLEAQKHTDGLQGTEIRYAKAGPRVKKIIDFAYKTGVPVVKTDNAHLDALVRPLSEPSRDHRGIVLVIGGENPKQKAIDFDSFIAELSAACEREKRGALVMILDSVTDPHNVGAVIRSCDQLGAELLVLPEKRGASDSAVIERSSAGASAWVPTAVVTNLVRAVEKLQKAGFWVYGAAADGTAAHSLDLKGKIAFIMGSEGSGISRLLAKKCDGFISIPCCGKLDSLNVSVAAGILLYERRRQCLTKG
ncbi:23S rRNA (guanosine(2251)-2'-O)-methyltransferase RlmB [Treponema sp. OMZ 840]|uniref:23S rRNA (guanosine(2251)-2'-O)-methyltransferase RlmB n=1 Tax=Treponema sp. OMZ 840 TaxID=244313 RepID=UPI003D9188E1